MITADSVRRHYDSYPYPEISLLARPSLAQLYSLHLGSAHAACFGSAADLPERPRILVAGSGTFEPLALKRAHPRAVITAVDISSMALKRLRWRLWLQAEARNVRFVEADLAALPGQLGEFDYIVATGVLHHMPDPAAGLRELTRHLAPRGVMRIMLYSRWGRSHIYRWQRIIRALRLGEKELRSLVRSLPPEHPMRAHFYLYRDQETSAGLRDGFFHVLDRPFDALELPDFLGRAGLEARAFLHPAGGRPEDLAPLLERANIHGKALSPWECVAVLDRLGELESNYHFLACRKAEPFVAETAGADVILNEVLARSLPAEIHSRSLGETLDLRPLSGLRFPLKKSELTAVLGRENYERLRAAGVVWEKR